jgi:pseudaminic acid biosynthesis-associated methylase
VSTPEKHEAEATRLEDLWAQGFGDEYVARNLDAGEGREAFWYALLERLEPSSVLEIGCNVGANIRWIVDRVPPKQVFGVDINESALATIRQRFAVNAVWSPARRLPFRDREFELVFTAGVLIHQPEATLPLVMAEAVRTARTYVLALEYFSNETVEVAYRGRSGALFKRDYGALYSELFPELELEKTGSLGKDEGWDDVTWWLFRRTA